MSESFLFVDFIDTVHMETEPTIGVTTRSTSIRDTWSYYIIHNHLADELQYVIKVSKTRDFRNEFHKRYQSNSMATYRTGGLAFHHRTSYPSTFHFPQRVR